MTLSHCWGGIESFRLLKTNHAQLEREIPFGELAKVVRHAIMVAAWAAVDYLWVDSLCIIQDDEDDWQRESTRMDAVYRHATCNIAATGYVNGSFGLFSDTIRRPFVVTLSKPVLRDESDFLPAGSYALVDLDMWTRSVEEAPLNRRGWVVQERFLSPRTVHFGIDQMFWECRELAACEVFRDGIPQALEPRNTKREFPVVPFHGPFYHMMSGQPVIGDGKAVFESLRAWSSVLRSYSASELTVAQDKLIAIAGLARYLQPMLNSDYVAGLWKRFLLSQLLWSSFNLGGWGNAPRTSARYVSEGEESDIYIAPSWSWASTYGYVEVQVPSDLAPPLTARSTGWDNALVTIKDCSVQPVAGTEFGRVKGGTLTLEGRLMVLGFPVGEHDLQAKERVLSLSLVIDGRRGTVAGKHGPSGRNVNQRNTKLRFIEDWNSLNQPIDRKKDYHHHQEGLENKAKNDDEILFVMPLRRETRTVQEYSSAKYTRISGLIIGPLASAVTPARSRITCGSTTYLPPSNAAEGLGPMDSRTGRRGLYTRLGVFVSFDDSQTETLTSCHTKNIPEEFYRPVTNEGGNREGIFNIQIM